MSFDESIGIRCDMFAREWNSGRIPALGDFLDGISGAQRPALLEQLITVDIEMRERFGKSVSSEDYRRLGDDVAELAAKRLAVKGIDASRRGQPKITQCSACGVTVMPRRDNSCPSCGELMQETLASDELASTQTRPATSAPDHTNDSDFAATFIVSRRTAEGSLELAVAPDSGEEFPPGTLLNDRYRLDAELGRGGMGTVFISTDMRLERKVAVKFIRVDRIADDSER